MRGSNVVASTPRVLIQVVEEGRKSLLNPPGKTKTVNWGSFTSSASSTGNVDNPPPNSAPAATIPKAPTRKKAPSKAQSKPRKDLWASEHPHPLGPLHGQTGSGTRVLPGPPQGRTGSGTHAPPQPPNTQGEHAERKIVKLRTSSGAVTGRSQPSRSPAVVLGPFKPPAVPQPPATDPTHAIETRREPPKN
ncbi:hypothetical protein FA13DRAFT_1714897 [Coprinellus micaceus]|uniref:Uncharacterized protein n=1 Tax=Coprinellus micaceus TaxID=71717 RepID=A0A4Y7SQK4_COPMI|nr:hypothetical protein FA13DRAFT_1714897 [Coprinellus micaceus]